MMSLASRMRSESGYILPTVMALGLIMLVLVSGSLTVTTSGLVKAGHDQDQKAALAAAYAGVEEYQSRLANDNTYQQFGNPASTFTATPASSVTLPLGAAANPAFNTKSTETWATIPGSSERASFRYEINNATFGVSGILHLRVTGRVGDTTQSIVADLKQKGFIDFLYFTNYETFDPSIVVPDKSITTSCETYAWATPARDTKCGQIQFAAADVIDGPVHSNDQLVICSTVFKKAVTSASTLPYVNACTAKDPQFLIGGKITRVSTIPIPPTNTQMRKEGRNDIKDDVPRPGCLYTGPTSITLNAGGTMTVVSPWTRKTQVSYTAGIDSATPSMCGDITQLNSTAGATFTVPEKNLVFVQDVPTLSSDPNYPTGGTPASFTCTGSGADQSWKYGTTIYPMAGESRPVTSTSVSPAYGCRSGDAFVKGVLKGEMTIASDNFVYITGNITYASVTNSILGIVGQNAVWVWNPMKFKYDPDDGTISSGTNLLTDSGRTIQAAIMSVGHTFMVQNYQYGAKRGDLTVLGAIAQKFRGTVSLGGTTGYIKKYSYDDRLVTTAPPKFLSPVSTTYGVTQYAGVSAAYTSKGAPAP